RWDKTHNLRHQPWDDPAHNDAAAAHRFPPRPAPAHRRRHRQAWHTRYQTHCRSAWLLSPDAGRPQTPADGYGIPDQRWSWLTGHWPGYWRSYSGADFAHSYLSQRCRRYVRVP